MTEHIELAIVKCRPGTSGLKIDLTDGLDETESDYQDDTQNWTTLQQKQQHYADKRGCDILEPGPCEAFIDIDSDEAFAIFKHRWQTFHRAEPKARYVVSASPSGKFGHYHVVVSVARTLQVYERLWIQAILGDDPLRGLLSYKETRDYGGSPVGVSVLFVKKENPE